MKRLFFLLLPLLLFTIAPTPTGAQDDVFYVFNQADVITFYQVDAAGEMTQVGALPPTIGIWMFTEVEWTIPVPADITISPDQRHVAFVAYRDEQDVDLFIYSLETDTLTQVDLPSTGSVKWSPASDALLVTLPQAYYESPRYSESGYLYDLTTGMLTHLTDMTMWSVTWLPDNETIIFISFCLPSCQGVAEIFMMNRYTQTVVALTDHGTQPSPTPSSNICSLAWSQFSQRIYYAVGCIRDEYYREYLYSVDLNGGSRIEAALPEEFPNDRVTMIRDIRPSITGDIFLAVEAHSEIDNGQSVVLEEFWRVVRVSEPEQISTVIEYSFGDSAPLLLGGELSPDNGYLALYGTRYRSTSIGNLIVIDLGNNTIAYDAPNLQSICEVSWLHDQTLVYTELAQNCNPWSEPDSTSLLNVETGVITPVAQDVPGFTWLLLSR